MARRQQGEHAFAMLLLKLTRRVGGVVGGHAAEDLRDLLVGAVLQELALVVLVELLEHVGLELPVVLADRLDDLLALSPGGGLHEIGDLGRMQLGELGVGDPQAHRRDVTHEWLHAGPIQEVASGDALPERPRQQPAQASTRPRVHADHAPGAGDVGQLDLVRPHQSCAVDIDQLAVEHVALEQDLLLATLEVAQVELGLAQDHPIVGLPTRGRRPDRRCAPRPSPKNR